MTEKEATQIVTEAFETLNNVKGLHLQLFSCTDMTTYYRISFRNGFGNHIWNFGLGWFSFDPKWGPSDINILKDFDAHGLTGKSVAVLRFAYYFYKTYQE